MGWARGRRWTAFGVSVACAAALGAVAPRAVAQADAGGKVPVGQADAAVGRMTIYAGNYRLTTSMGVARSRLENKAASAESAFVDYGLLGVLLSGSKEFPTLARLGVPAEYIEAGASGFAFPTPARADTGGHVRDVDRDPALPGLGETALHLGPLSLGSGREEAHAVPDPAQAAARTTLGSMGVIGMSGGGGGVSEARVAAGEVAASSSLGELRFSAGPGGPPVAVFRGLQWHSRQTRPDKGGTPVVEAGFAVGSAEVGGQVFRFDTPGEFARAVGPINELLRTLGTGLRVEAPEVRHVEDTSIVTPLAVDLRNSALLKASFGQVWSNTASLVTEMELALVSEVPEAGLLVTVGNVVLGAAAGSGGARLELGGVSTSLSERDAYVPEVEGFADEPGAVGAELQPTPGEFSSGPYAGPPAQGFEAPALALGRQLTGRPAPPAAADPVASPWGALAGGVAAAVGIALLDHLRLRRRPVGGG
jgi:hypothetical protein